MNRDDASKSLHQQASSIHLSSTLQGCFLALFTLENSQPQGFGDTHFNTLLDEPNE